MSERDARIRVLEAKTFDTAGYRMAVSLHCHTDHSKENLGFIPHYASRIPVVSEFFKREMEGYLRTNGKKLDFRRAYWTPPLTARRVVELEAERIERELDVEAMISLTDHDDIGACTLLRALNIWPNLPISTEWTVPFRSGCFHLGVHNIPPEFSAGVLSELQLYTSRPDEKRLPALLEHLNGFSEALLVLNHPLWNLDYVDRDTHLILLTAFLAQYGKWIHALEVNGYRSWRENNLTLRIAQEMGYPVISGGDRHGCAPNATLNLTNSTTFVEFVSEVRNDKVSEVVLMPEYRENLLARTLEAAADVLRYYPDHPQGRQLWTDRVFLDLGEGSTVRPLSYYWKRGGPSWVRSSLWVMCFLGSPRFRPALRLALAREERIAL